MSNKSTGSTCTGPSYKGSDLRELWRRALERCGKPAKWLCALGPRCDECMEDLEKASQPGAPTLLGIVADERGVPAAARGPWKRPIS
jgi:hypothetical protein